MTPNEIGDHHLEWIREVKWDNVTPLECLAMICGEVGEAVNECRGEVPTDNFGVELADIIIRTAVLARMHGIDINARITEKMALCRERGTRGRVR